jgi:hypothetical protein
LQLHHERSQLSHPKTWKLQKTLKLQAINVYISMSSNHTWCYCWVWKRYIGDAFFIIFIFRW